MNKLKNLFLNHKKVFAVAVSVIVLAAALGCGALVGFKAGERANRVSPADYSQPVKDNIPVDGGGIDVPKSREGISADEAEAIALQNAGFSADEATVIKSEVDNDDGVLVYDVEFIGSGGKYEYEISAETGEILHSEVELQDESASVQPDTTDNAGVSVSLDEAKAKALADAGLAEATFTKAKLDYDDNRDVYEIEFYTAAAEYDYEIAVYGGEILKKDIEFKDSKKNDVGKDIGMDAAKEAAVKDAGFNVEDVSFIKAKKDTDDGVSVYEIEFSTADAVYDYEINAADGRIIKEEIKIEVPAVDNSGKALELEAAKDIALKDAGVKAADASFTKTKLDRDDGRDVYELEFYTSDREYEYEIDAQSGAILDRDSERRKGSGTLNSTGDYIGLDEAKRIALKHCGLSASAVTFTTAKQDCDDGVDCYELEFCTPEHEYEYEIHCVSGEILHDECHRHDRDDNDCGHSGGHH